MVPIFVLSVGLLPPAARLFARQTAATAKSQKYTSRLPRLSRSNLVEVRAFSTSKLDMEKLKVAVIGQSQFAAEVYKKVTPLTNSGKIVYVKRIGQGGRGGPGLEQSGSGLPLTVSLDLHNT